MSIVELKKLSVQGRTSMDSSKKVNKCNLYQLKKKFDEILNEFEKKEVLLSNVQVFLNVDDDAFPFNVENIDIGETEEGESVVYIDASSVFEDDEEENEDGDYTEHFDDDDNQFLCK
jgi:hypothetical protein